MSGTFQAFTTVPIEPPEVAVLGSENTSRFDVKEWDEGRWAAGRKSSRWNNYEKLEPFWLVVWNFFIFPYICNNHPK